MSIFGKKLYLRVYYFNYTIKIQIYFLLIFFRLKKILPEHIKILSRKGLSIKSQNYSVILNHSVSQDHGIFIKMKAKINERLIICLNIF